MAGIRANTREVRGGRRGLRADDVKMSHPDLGGFKRSIWGCYSALSGNEEICGSPVRSAVFIGVWQYAGRPWMATERA
eukprot:270775-Prymnesium_polylepis.1